MINEFPRLPLGALSLDPQTGGLDEASQQRIQEWYYQTRPILDTVEQLVSDLLAELQQVARYEVAFTKCRVKSLRSVTEKLQKILLEKEAKNEAASECAHEVLNDLVGGRIVFYFEPDRRLGFEFFHEDPRFYVLNVTLYEALQADSHLHHASMHSLIQRIKTSRDDLQGFTPTIRHNGYESLHMVVKLEEDLLPPSLAAGPGAQNARKIVGEARVEIQVRSMLQDLWAQPEHGFSYASRKQRRPESSSLEEIYDDSFHTHKLLVKAVERFHSSIWETYRNGMVSVPTLKQVSSSLGPRIRDANLPDSEAAILDRVDREISRNTDSLAIFRTLEEVFDRLDQDGEQAHSLWSLKLPRSAREWLRQRLLLLFLGYLVSIRSEQSLVDAVSARIRREDKRVSSHRYDLARQIYVLLKTGDAWFIEHLKYRNEIRVRRDPLVSYRLAGVFLLASPPNYFRGREELREAVRHYEQETESRAWSTQGDPILNYAHLRRRLAKFGWYLFLSRDERLQNLEEACANLRLALETSDFPSDAHLAARERSKILYDAITIEFYRAVLARPTAADSTSEPFPLSFDAAREAERRRDFLAAIEYLYPTMQTHLTQYLDPSELLGYQIALGSHGHQALAIWAWAHEDLELARAAVVKARALLHHADERPLVRDVIRRIESFLVIRRPGENPAP